jgi:hypothetical protein
MVRYRIDFGERSVELPRGELLVGRDEACQIRFASPSVSRRHLRILFVGEAVMAYDLGSSNGTWVNGKPLKGRAELEDGDSLRVGDETFVLRRVPGQSDWLDSPKTEPRGRPFAYSTPRYRTCRYCLALVDEDDSACPKCRRETLPPEPPPTGESPKDRRLAQRQAIDAEALYVSPSLTLGGRLVDISKTGLFMASELTDPVGTKADVVLFCISAGGARFEGVVSRVVSDESGSATPGMGIHFTHVVGSARRWLEQYLAGHAEPLGETGCGPEPEGST